MNIYNITAEISDLMARQITNRIRIMLNTIFPTRKNPYVPGRNAKEVLKTDFSGTEFSIALPPTSNGFASSTDRHLESLNIEDSNVFSNEAKRPFEEGLPWVQSFLTREPTLCAGFLGSNQIGHMTIAGNIWYFNDMPDGMTLFNPEHCEQAVRRVNYFFMGPGSLSDRNYIQPINWQILEQSGVRWIYHEGLDFDTEDWKRQYPSEPLPALATYYRCRYAVPVGERHLLSLVFSYGGYQPVTFALKALYELRRECFATIKLRYSELAKQKIEQAKQRWPDAHYSKHRDPEKWVLHRFVDHSKYEIREAGSPPPQWQSNVKIDMDSIVGRVSKAPETT